MFEEIMKERNDKANKFIIEKIEEIMKNDSIENIDMENIEKTVKRIMMTGNAEEEDINKTYVTLTLKRTKF